MQELMKMKITRRIKRARLVRARLMLFSICLIIMSLWTRIFTISNHSQIVLLVGSIMGVLIIPLFLISFKRLVYINNNELEFISMSLARLIGISLMINGFGENIYKKDILSTDTTIMLIIFISIVLIQNYMFKIEFLKLVDKELSRE